MVMQSGGGSLMLYHVMSHLLRPC